MAPTSTSTPGPEGRPDAGFSLLEVLIVLALLALSAAVVLPSGAVMLDRVGAHAAFFDVQRQLSDLRLAAYRAQTPTVIAAPGAPEPGAVQLTMKSGWSYGLDHPIRISEGGACAPAAVALSRRGKVVMHLRMADAACHLLRLD
jgi:prepilin-type N-terminal cleavage/methylation domain-containing protein